MQSVFAGIDVGGTRTKVGLATSSGQVLSSQLLETGAYQDAESFLQAIAVEIGRQSKAVSVSIAGAGLGCPGRIDFASGAVAWLKTKLEFLEGVQLAARLGEWLGCVVVYDNDVNTILAGEMKFGANQDIFQHWEGFSEIRRPQATSLSLGQKPGLEGACECLRCRG